MDINVIAGSAAFLLAALLVWIATRRLERALEHRAEAAAILAEARSLVDSVAGNAPQIIGTPIPVGSEEGQAILAALRKSDGGFIPCGCPNCEEDRRIAKAKQNRGER